MRSEQKAYANKIIPIRKNGHLLLVTLLLANMIVNETLPVISDPVLGGGVQSVVVSTVLIVMWVSYLCAPRRLPRRELTRLRHELHCHDLMLAWCYITRRVHAQLTQPADVESRASSYSAGVAFPATTTASSNCPEFFASRFILKRARVLAGIFA